MGHIKRSIFENDYALSLTKPEPCNGGFEAHFLEIVAILGVYSTIAKMQQEVPSLTVLLERMLLNKVFLEMFFI